MSKRRPKQSAQERADEFNERNPVGSQVQYKKHDGWHDATVRTAAYVAASGDPVVFLEGVSGFYSIDFVRPR